MKAKAEEQFYERVATRAEVLRTLRRVVAASGGRGADLLRGLRARDGGIAAGSSKERETRRCREDRAGAQMKATPSSKSMRNGSGRGGRCGMSGFVEWMAAEAEGERSGGSKRTSSLSNLCRRVDRGRSCLRITFRHSRCVMTQEWKEIRRIETGYVALPKENGGIVASLHALVVGGGAVAVAAGAGVISGEDHVLIQRRRLRRGSSFCMMWKSAWTGWRILTGK